MLRLLRDIGYFIILCLMVVGVGGILYHTIGAGGWIERLLGDMFGLGPTTAIAILVGVVFAGWLIRRWLIASQRNALFNDFLMYGMVALGLLFLGRWLIGGSF